MEWTTGGGGDAKGSLSRKGDGGRRTQTGQSDRDGEKKHARKKVPWEFMILQSK